VAEAQLAKPQCIEVWDAGPCGVNAKDNLAALATPFDTTIRQPTTTSCKLRSFSVTIFAPGQHCTQWLTKRLIAN